MDISRQNYFTVNGAAVELVHNENYYVFDLDLRNVLYSTGLGSLANYKLTPVVKEQRLRFRPGCSRPNIRAGNAANMHSGFVEDTNFVELDSTGFNSAMVQAQVDFLKEAYPDVKLVFLVIPSTPIVQGNNLILSDEGDNLTG